MLEQQQKLDNAATDFSVCEICNSPAGVVSASLPGYVEGKSFAIVHCSGCQVAYAVPRRAEDRAYEAIYNNAEQIPGYDRYRAYASVVKCVPDPLHFLATAEPMYWAVSEAITRLTDLPRGGKGILEIGCGFGYLTFALWKRGYRVLGIDLSENAVQAATARFGNLYRCASLEQLAADPTQRFGAVVLTEVIEHVEAPIEFMRAILRVLVPGGVVIITTPNRSRNKLAELWDTDLPPIHWWWFTEQSLNVLASRVGCVADMLDFTSYNARVAFPKGLPFQRDSILSKDFAVLTPSRRTLRVMVLREIGKYLLLCLGILPLVRRMRHSRNVESGPRSGSLAAILRVQS